MAEPAVTYVTSRWGEPTQTFVRREAAALQAAGCSVRALSLKQPAPNDESVPCTWLTPREMTLGFLRATLARPITTVSLLARVLLFSSPRNVPRQLAAAVTGIAWAGRGVVPDGHLHAHFGWVATTAAWAAARSAGRPFSVVLHAFELHDTRYVDRFTPVPLRAARQVFTISRRDQTICLDRWGIAAEVLRMGVPATWMADPGLARDAELVVSVGSLVEKKGHHVLLAALGLAPGWRCVIVGEGPLRAELERQAAVLGLGDRVRFAGRLGEAEVRELYRTAAVACLASVEAADGDRDGIPVALIEAMACGCPVVSTDVGAIVELVDGAGILVPSGDAPSLAAALDQLRDPAARTRLSEQGRRRVGDGWLSHQAAQPVLELVVR